MSEVRRTAAETVPLEISNSPKEYPPTPRSFCTYLPVNRGPRKVFRAPNKNRGSRPCSANLETVSVHSRDRAPHNAGHLPTAGLNPRSSSARSS